MPWLNEHATHLLVSMYHWTRFSFAKWKKLCRGLVTRKFQFTRVSFATIQWNLTDIGSSSFNFSKTHSCWILSIMVWLFLSWTILPHNFLHIHLPDFHISCLTCIPKSFKHKYVTSKVMLVNLHINDSYVLTFISFLQLFGEDISTLHTHLLKVPSDYVFWPNTFILPLSERNTLIQSYEVC